MGRVLTWVAKPGKLKNVHKTISRFFLWFSPFFSILPSFFTSHKYLKGCCLPCLYRLRRPCVRRPAPSSVILIVPRLQHTGLAPECLECWAQYRAGLGWAGLAGLGVAGEIKQLDNGSVQWPGWQGPDTAQVAAWQLISRLQSHFTH